MLFNLYQISFSIKSDAASLLINLAQARVLGRLGGASKVLASNFWSASVEVWRASSVESWSASSVESWSVESEKKCLSLLTLNVLCLLFANFNFATDSLISMIVAGPSHFGANFLLTLRKSV